MLLRHMQIMLEWRCQGGAAAVNGQVLQPLLADSCVNACMHACSQKNEPIPSQAVSEADQEKPVSLPPYQNPDPTDPQLQEPSLHY